MSLDSRTILFFIAGITATAGELDLISRIRGTVHVRNVLYDTTYGGKLEPADGLAGAIPTDYLTGEGETIDTALYPDGDVTPLITAAAEDFNVFPATLAIKVGEIKDLGAITADYDDDTALITLTNKAAASTVDWASSDETKATVDTNGLVTGVAAGSATITATYTAVGADPVTSTSVVTVSAASIENVLVLPATLTVAALGTGNLFGAEAKSDGSISNVTTTGVWSSSDETKATVGAATGIVTHVGAGTATITLTKGGKTSTCVVTLSA